MKNKMMNKKIKQLYQITILFGSISFILLLALATPTIYNSTDFCIYNSGWNGCSQIAKKTYYTGKFQPTFSFNKTSLTPVQHSFINYDINQTNSTIIIIGPQTPFTKEEATYIEHFLNKGGTLFLADDFGTSNDLLSQINASSRFSHKLMLDLSFEKKASFVTIFNIYNQSHPLTKDISGILLNYPSSLSITENTTSLAGSSEMSWLDIDTNGKEDGNEPHGPFVIYAIEPYGNGEIILFSGPSLLINSMDDHLDNKVFLNNIFEYLVQNKQTVIIDESHRDIPIPFKLGYIFPSVINVPLKISIIILVVLVFLFIFTTIPNDIYNSIENQIKQKFLKNETILKQSSSELINEVLEKYPSWNKTKLENIVNGMKKNE